MALTLTHKEAMRFVEKIRLTETGCWEWTGAKTRGNCHTNDRGGYGKFYLRGKQVLAHRVMFAALHGRQADTVEHTCRNRACVRPHDLADLPIRENILRGQGIFAQNARKTICKNGHPFTTENTKPQKGGRECRRCRLEIYRRYHRRQREKVGTAAALVERCTCDPRLKEYL